MANKNAIKLTEGILEEIGTTANALRSELARIVCEPDRFDGSSAYLLESIAEKIGWLADLALEKLTGAPDICGDAEDWFLPSSYNSLRKETAQ